MLAGGRARRLEPLSAVAPKALLPVLDRALIEHQLAALRAAGIRAVTVVGGHLGERLRAHLGDGHAFGLELRHVTQPEPRGIAHALTCARETLTGPFVCLLGDLWFDAGDLLALVRSAGDGREARLGVRSGDGPDELARNYEVVLASDGTVRAVREKPPAGPGLRGVGVYAFPPEFLAVAAATPPSGLRGEHELTDAIQRALEAGLVVRAVPFAWRDHNLSTPGDLLAANLEALRRAGLARHVAPSAELGPGVELVDSVVLEGASVAPGARLERVLVFPGQRVPAGLHREVLFVAGECVSAPPRR